ncbi:MAG: IS110 family transposase [Sedimentisphaerales bacterium]|nr:IS110 family transposase [Sedimentisphaerales bacterium]
MRKTLYCGVDLHSNNAMYVITDRRDKQLFKQRLPNELPMILERLEPFRPRLKVVAVESTYNWYWLVDGLQDHGYPVVLAQPSKMDQYDGIKEADDLTDAAFLARLSRLNILPTGYIYPREGRPVRDLLRRRMLIVQQRTALKLSLQNMAMRQTGRSLGWRTLDNLSDADRTELLGDHDCLTFVTEQQVDLIERLSDTIKRFAEKILEHTQLKPTYACLLTMPGVGVILALTIMLETGDIGRFKRVGDYTSYCRCVRAMHTSNGKNKSKNNGKNGNAYLAWAFVEAVHHAIRACPQAKRFYDKKLAKRNGALATKALAAKWSKAAYYMMKRQEPFDLARVFG